MLALDARGAELIQSALAGDAPSLEALAGLMRGRVYAYLRRLALDEHRAEDLTQDTLVAVLQSMSGIRQLDRFWPWVFAIANNSVREHYRSQAVRRATSISSLSEDHIQPESRSETDGLARLLRKELAELVHRAMGQIGQRDRAVLVLRFYEGMPHAGIASLLGCTELTARVWLVQAKHALKRALGGQHDKSATANAIDPSPFSSRPETARGRYR